MCASQSLGVGTLKEVVELAEGHLAELEEVGWFSWEDGPEHLARRVGRILFGGICDLREKLSEVRRTWSRERPPAEHFGKTDLERLLGWPSI